MSSIVIPNDFAAQRTLLSGIIAKNTELGANSPLTAWLKKKEIDLVADNKAGDSTQACETQRIAYENAAVNANQSRDLAFKPVYSFLLQGAQALKKWFAPNYAALLDWSVPITTSGRIDYPSSFEERSEICTNFIAQLNTYEPGTSPLQAYIVANDVDVAALSDSLTEAIENNAAGIKNTKLGESATEQRNLYWKNVVAHIRLIADFLKSVYPNNVRVLGEWGFVVDDGEKKPVVRKSKFMIGETKVLTGIKMGYVATNTGKTTLNIWQGKDTSKASVALLAGDKMGLVNGYSTMTVQNSSSLETGEISIGLPE